MLSSYRIVIAGCGFAFGIVASTSAFAQTKPNCRAEIAVIGGSRIGEKLALDNAIAAWQGTATAKHGGFWGDYAKNADQKSSRCFKAYFGFMKCEVRGRPCEEKGAADNSATLSCGPGSKPACDDQVKWMQSRLNAKGAKPQLEVDGVAGDQSSQTNKAIRKFKLDNRLGDNDDPEKLLAALRN